MRPSGAERSTVLSTIGRASMESNAAPRFHVRARARTAASSSLGSACDGSAISMAPGAVALTLGTGTAAQDAISHALDKQNETFGLLERRARRGRS